MFDMVTTGIESIEEHMNLMTLGNNLHFNQCTGYEDEPSIICEGRNNGINFYGSASL